ncbi:hypothetical protein QVD17_36791 [Tagetes erecta]|uniref:Uncharacterized protein n=1 Tax=Tagetes erecta TaxID=13708 RepID=A0AAD8JVB1_TARER|nr:hypothetical protein QVD17_36791 [Tagetes erecta]
MYLNCYCLFVSSGKHPQLLYHCLPQTSANQLSPKNDFAQQPYTSSFFHRLQAEANIRDSSCYPSRVSF